MSVQPAGNLPGRGATAVPAGGGVPPSRLLAADVLRVGASGLSTRRLRAALSALGVAIGIASMVAVLGLSASSRAGLVAQLDALGTNLLTVAPGQSFFGADAALPIEARDKVAFMPGVVSAASATDVGVTVRRTDRISPNVTSGISIAAVQPGLLATLDGRVARGRFLDAATARLPAVVLGRLAARRLGIDAPGERVWVAGDWFMVLGILAPLPLAPELDRAALVGRTIAQAELRAPETPSRLYVRADPERVTAVRDLLAGTANPEHPEEVDVSRPSDALAAKAAGRGAFTALFLGLGAVALLVGGIGIANTMVISVLERRGEIGLRRALGATRHHVRTQFLVEALLLSAAGGAAGVAAGAAVTAGYAATQGWPVSLSSAALAGGMAAALAIGALAGLYPAARAARLAPAEALRAT